MSDAGLKPTRRQYAAARAVTAINPNAHVVLTVVVHRTPRALALRKKARLYV